MGQTFYIFQSAHILETDNIFSVLRWEWFTGRVGKVIRHAAWLGTGTTVPASPADEAAHKALSGIADT